MARGKIRTDTLEDLKGVGRVYYGGKSVEVRYSLRITQRVQTLMRYGSGGGEVRGRREGEIFSEIPGPIEVEGLLSLDDEDIAFDIRRSLRAELVLEDGRKATIEPNDSERGSGMVRFVLSGALR